MRRIARGQDATETGILPRRPVGIALLLPAFGLALLVLMFLLSKEQPGAVEASTASSGTVIDDLLFIDRDTTWTTDGSPYEVRGNVIISPTATLYIQGGVRVFLPTPTPPDPWRRGIGGKGNLVVRGTADKRVVLEGSAPTVADPAPIMGISVEGTQEVEYADLRRIRIGGCEAFGSVVTCPKDEPAVTFDHVNFLEDYFAFAAARVCVTNSTISRNYVTRLLSGEIVNNLIWLSRDNPDPILPVRALQIISGTVMSNTIIYNGGGGIYVPYPSSAAITITANNIYGNARFDYIEGFSSSSGPVLAPNNWWGTTDIPTIQSHVLAVGGGPARLEFLPVATGPIPGTPLPNSTYLPLVMAGVSGW